MPKVIGAYTLTDMRTGRFYVGSSGNIEKRVKTHLTALRSNRHHCIPLQELWNSGNIQLIASEFETETREEAYVLEQDIIDRYLHTSLMLNVSMGAKGGDNFTRHPNRDDIISRIKESLRERIHEMTPLEKRLVYGRPGENNGMWGRTHTPETRAYLSSINLGITRRSGFTLSDEHRAMISEAAKQRTGEKNPFYGRQHSAETKQRISEIKKDQGLIPTNARKVSVDGVVYTYVTEASRAQGVSPALIIHRLQSTKEKYSGYTYVVECPTTIETTSKEDKGVE
jgi:group I intron endonuclease